MDKIFASFLSRLSYGEASHLDNRETENGVIGTLARVYEKARNALEYRADHLVRRAAIERILKRRIILDAKADSLAKNLLTELGWARYLTFAEIKNAQKLDLAGILTKYLRHKGSSVPQDWIIKMASAEIEEHFNLNTDYKQFTLLAFQVFKEKIKISDDNSDLLIYFAVDKVYAGSDDEQIAYHILKLGGDDPNYNRLEEAWRLFNLAKSHPLLSRISRYVRREMPPLVLLRDMYFYSPKKFKETLMDSEIFNKNASDVLEIQIQQLTGRVKTAGVRSVAYVFLTKMLVAFGAEVPLEYFIYGHFSFIPLLINLAFPPFLMWISALQIKLPGKLERADLIDRSWFLVNNLSALSDEDGNWSDEKTVRTGFKYSLFSALYLVFFAGVFIIIFYILGLIKFTLISRVVFVFFLTIITFFAYRINQIAKIYSWKKPGRTESSFGDVISVPILAIGSRLSRGLSKLNFLAIVFDFILEAPFKIILGFLDSWVQFLSIKKEEQIIE